MWICPYFLEETFPVKTKWALAGVAQWIECQLVGWVPSLGVCEGQPIDYLSHIDDSPLLFLPSPLSKNK